MDAEKNFAIIVVATMSAGKSTLLNAMIGADMLPSKNEACTATVFRIEDHDDKPIFEGRCHRNDTISDWETITTDLLKNWNVKGIKQIEIRGNLPNIKNTPCNHRVVFFDTPGPNNSLEDNHEKITKKVIAQADYCALICVLNATNHGVNDEWRLLSHIKKEIDKQNIPIQPIFVINKIDSLAVERGEIPMDLVNGSMSYLIELGFANPIIVPACSNYSLEIRRTIRSAQRMTTKEVAGEYRGAAKLKSFFSRRYKATTSSRQQSHLVNCLNSFMELEKSYKDALVVSETMKTIFESVNVNKLPNFRRKIKISGTYFSFADLYRVDMLCGIPCLEKLLENELHKFAKKSKNQRRK